MLEFKPETIIALKERYKEAIATAYSTEHISKNPQERPGAKRQHVFDFEDGIRIIVSRDLLKGQEFLHFSGSAMPSIYKGLSDHSLLSRMIINFAKISNYSGKVQLAGFSKEGIPHFYIKLADLN